MGTAIPPKLRCLPDAVADRVSRAVAPHRRRILLALLVAQVTIVVTGGIVRVTGSGLGCPTWPECTPGSLTPTSAIVSDLHSGVEFGNRLLAVCLGLIAAVAVVAVLTDQSAGRRSRRLVWLQISGVLAQAVIGGLSVLAGLAPLTVLAHFLVSGLLVAGATALYLDAAPPALPCSTAPAVVRRMVRVVVVALTATIVAGTLATASGPHAGDTTAQRLRVDPEVLAGVHGGAATSVVIAVTMLGIALSTTPLAPRARPYVRGLLLILLAQLAAGGITALSDRPALGVLVHMLGACVLIVTATALSIVVRRAGSHTPA